MTETNTKSGHSINSIINIATSNVQQAIQNNQTINGQSKNEGSNNSNESILLQNVITERNALITERNALKKQNASLWNIIEKQKNTIQKLQNQLTLLQQSQKRKGKHSDKNSNSEDKEKSSHHPLPEVPPNNSPQPPQRGTSFNSQQQRTNSTSSIQNQMGTLLNEKYIRKGSAPNVKDHDVIYDLKNRVRSNSENAINDENLIINYEMGTESINDTDTDDNVEDRPLRTDSSGNYKPPHPERLSSSKANKSKSSKSVPLSIPIQIDTVRVKVIGSIIKMNEKGKEIVSFIILISRLNNSGNEENEKIEKTYSDFVQLDSKLRSLAENKILISKMGKLPDKNLFTSNSPTKRDQRKIELELYLQNLISVFKNNKEIDNFLTTNIVETGTSIKNEKNQSTKEGYLIKRGKNFGGWKTRYFVLSDNVLSYYDSYKGNYGGTIKLKDSQVISLPNEANDYRHGFMIMEYRKQSVEGSNEKITGKHILCAENDEERDEWIIAIGQAIEAISQNSNDQIDNEKNLINTEKLKNLLNVEQDNDYDSADDVEEQLNSNFSSTNSIQNGYQNQMYIPQPANMKNKQQSLANSQSSSYSEFDFQKSGDFVDENERLMQQVVEPPFGINTGGAVPNSTPPGQKKAKKVKDEKKKRLWGRNKSKHIN